jgi:hypothetical protein
MYNAVVLFALCSLCGYEMYDVLCTMYNAVVLFVLCPLCGYEMYDVLCTMYNAVVLYVLYVVIKCTMDCIYNVQ